MNQISRLHNSVYKHATISVKRGGNHTHRRKMGGTEMKARDWDISFYSPDLENVNVLIFKLIKLMKRNG